MNRLKKLRNEKKLTLRELAEVLNIHRDSLMRMENGSQGISDEYYAPMEFKDQKHRDKFLSLSNEEQIYE